MKAVKKQLITALVLLLLSLAAFGGSLYYIFTMHESFLVFEREVLQTKADVEGFRSAESTLREISKSKDKVKELFLKNNIGEEAKFVEAVENLAESKNVTLESDLGREVIPNEENFQYFTLQGVAKGSLRDVYHFFLLLETFPIALEVRGASLEQLPPDVKGKVEWRFAFRVRALELK